MLGNDTADRHPQPIERATHHYTSRVLRQPLLAEPDWRNHASFRGPWRPKMGLFNSLLEDEAELLMGEVSI